MFIGKAERRFMKPECISPATDRQSARVATSCGSRPASGYSSLRYSAMARVSHNLTESFGKQRNKKEGDRSSNSARVEGSSEETTCSSKSSPAILHSNQ